MGRSKFISYESIKNYIENTSNSILLTLEKEFIEKNMTTYSKIKLQCLCGNIFETTFQSFKRQNKNKCDICSGRYSGKNRRLKYDNVKKFIENNGCKLISDEYINDHSILKIKCICGNIFYTTFNSFKYSNKIKCNECGVKANKDKKLLPYKKVYDFILENGCKLLSDEYNGSKSKLLIECECKNTFTTTLDGFKHRNIRRCKECSNISIGEKRIENFLLAHTINHKHQYRIPDCRNKLPLPFDFAIFNEDNSLKYLIEYQGIQHFIPQRFGGITEEKANEVFKYTLNNDKIKKEYCESKSIKLVIIKYTEFDDIENIIKKEMEDE